MLSPFAMAAASETVFSGARYTISWERARLGGEVVEHTECSNSWQNSGIAYTDHYTIDNSDDDAADTNSASLQTT